MAIIAGSDEYIGTMTHISDAGTAFATTVQATDLQGTDNNALQALPTAIQGATFNDNNANTNGNGGGTWDIVSTDAALWVIGAAKLAAVMKFQMATAADWTDPQSVMTVCTPQTGATLPSDLVMTSGTSGTGVACTGVYQYTVGLHDHAIVTGYDTRVHRQCRWCHAAKASTTGDVHLKDFVPPTTSARVLSGITVFAATTAGAASLTNDATPTSTKQESVVVGSGGCGKSGQTTKKSTKGQTVVFTMKSPVALAYA
jgi:hypothetical protein